MNVWLETLTGLMRENLWFAPVLSLVAGVVTLHPVRCQQFR